MNHDFLIDANYILPSEYKDATQVFIRQYHLPGTPIEFYSSTYSIPADKMREEDAVCQWRVTRRKEYPIEFQSAMLALRNAWADVLQATDYPDLELGAAMQRNYPFNESFDDLFLPVKEWTEQFIANSLR